MPPPHDILPPRFTFHEGPLIPFSEKMSYSDLKSALCSSPCRWLVTGVAGFIGSNILETLLDLDQYVVGVDNFSTGHQKNLAEVRASVGERKWGRLRFVEGDICVLAACQRVCSGIDFVLHQAALGSVPRSLADPLRTHQSNVNGLLNMLLAARDANVKRFVYASSSSVYGDHAALPKMEENIGRPLSPYAATKVINEIYAGIFSQAFGLRSIGLRYFNVFGPRQDPAGAYAAVIPRWIGALLQEQSVHIYGDGQTSRDFSFIDNVVQANLLAATADDPAALNQVFNIAIGETTTLKQLFELLQNTLGRLEPSLPRQKPIYNEFRPGDVRHSHADISKAQELLGYRPTHKIEEGLELTMRWYMRKLRPNLPQKILSHANEAPQDAVSCK